jgi:hypothetical protein
VTDAVTIGCWAGFWGDSQDAAAQIVRGAEIDYLVGDHLAEVTMALLARARAKDPNAGYVPDVVQALAPLLVEIDARSIKVITNAGALNPAACAQALREAACGWRASRATTSRGCATSCGPPARKTCSPGSRCPSGR